MPRPSAALVLAIFLLGTIASSDASARGGGRGGGGRGHHGGGSMGFHGSAIRTTGTAHFVPRTTVVVAAPVFYGGFRAPYYYPPVYGYPADPYYSGAPYYPAAPYYPSAPYYSAPYYPPEYIEQGQDQPAPPPPPGPEQQPAPRQQSAPTYWFCPSANNYFPYVRTCTSGWQQVAP